ncbi:MAG TPA: isochorismatase family protein [Acidimicrobiales bacterium]|nr:isochorismatase family protein [Acidimicrobiales bacterium]
MTKDALYGPGVALLVVDLQNDFVDPAGSLCVRGGDEVVSFANAQIRLAQAAGATVVYTQDWHPPHTPHFSQDGGTWPVHCVADSWGARFVRDLVVEGPVVHKGTGGEDGYSGFSMRDVESGSIRSTKLAELLAAADVHTVVLCGVATDYCVKETGLDAIRLGYKVIVLREGVRAVDAQPGDGRRALDALRAAGAELL